MKNYITCPICDSKIGNDNCPKCGNLKELEQAIAKSEPMRDIFRQVMNIIHDGVAQIITEEEAISETINVLYRYTGEIFSRKQAVTLLLAWSKTTIETNHGSISEEGETG